MKILEKPSSPSLKAVLRHRSGPVRVLVSCSANDRGAAGTKRLFVFGLGYTGRALACHLQSFPDWEVFGTCRREEELPRLEQCGATPFLFKGGPGPPLGSGAAAPGSVPAPSAALLEALHSCDYVLSTVPPVEQQQWVAGPAQQQQQQKQKVDADRGDSGGSNGATSGAATAGPDDQGAPPTAVVFDPVLQVFGGQLCELAPRLRWVGYLSSTSVYGDWQGQLVDESCDLRATSGKGLARVLAERQWVDMQQWCDGLPAVHVFRLGGIYGPGRSALDAAERRLLARAEGQGASSASSASVRSSSGGTTPGGAAGGTTGESASQRRRGRKRFTSRVHVADVCGALLASMQTSARGSGAPSDSSVAPSSPLMVVNVVDDDPAPRSQVMRYAERLLLQQRGQVGGGENGTASGQGGGGDARGQDTGGSTAGDGGEGRQPADEVASALLQESSAMRQASGRRGSSAQTGPRQQTSEAMPQESGATPQPPSLGLDEKRVSNARLVQELGVVLQFPSYREGLAAIAAGDLRPFN